MNNLDLYQDEARSMAIYPNLGDNIYYPTLGLAGEAGEVCEKVKKVMRDSDGEISQKVKDALLLEMGDVLWYLANIASELEVDLSEVAHRNLEKLYSRKTRGVLGGSGDNR